MDTSPKGVLKKCCIKNKGLFDFNLIDAASIGSIQQITIRKTSNGNIRLNDLSKNLLSITQQAYCLLALRRVSTKGCFL
jgi:hypothetical protein